MENGIETRNCQVELRVAAPEAGKAPRIIGYASVFNSLSQDLGGFKEIVKPGAFSRVLESGSDVLALFEHNRTKFLGRTRSGTLTLSEDNKGLRFEIEPPNTVEGRDVLELIRRGDVNTASFGFNTKKTRDAFSVDSDGQVIRQLTDIELTDVSPVFEAAYEQTSVEARSRAQACVSETSSAEDATRHRIYKARLDLIELD